MFLSGCWFWSLGCWGMTRAYGQVSFEMIRAHDYPFSLFIQLLRVRAAVTAPIIRNVVV